MKKSELKELIKSSLMEEKGDNILDTNKAITPEQRVVAKMLGIDPKQTKFEYGKNTVSLTKPVTVDLKKGGKATISKVKMGNIEGRIDSYYDEKGNKLDSIMLKLPSKSSMKESSTNDDYVIYAVDNKGKKKEINRVPKSKAQTTLTNISHRYRDNDVEIKAMKASEFDKSSVKEAEDTQLEKTAKDLEVKAQQAKIKAAQEKIANLNKGLQNENEDEEEGVDTSMDKVSKALSAVQKKLDQMFADFKMGKLDKEEYMSKRKELQAKRDKLNAALISFEEDEDEI